MDNVAVGYENVVKLLLGFRVTRKVDSPAQNRMETWSSTHKLGQNQGHEADTTF